MSVNSEKVWSYLETQMAVQREALDENTALFSSGMLDSFSMIELIQFLETSGGFKVGPAEVNLDNLDSVNKIVSFALAKAA